MTSVGTPWLVTVKKPISVHVRSIGCLSSWLAFASPQSKYAPPSTIAPLPARGVP
jgi:hypothetical protein